MRSGSVKVARAAVAAVVAVSFAARAGGIANAKDAIPNDDRTILHVLNRIGFGPRPGDVERVRTIGLQKYIEQQLYPDRLPDPALPARLEGLSTIRLSSRELASDFERPAIEARRARQQATAKDGEAPQMPQMPPAEQQRANRPLVELGEQKILRAAYSEHQLQEVLTDFWFNHFNVDARKGPDRFMVTEYEREVIRPHVLGKFRDLLGATAKSPAMLFYLDNWMSIDPNGPHAVAQQTPKGGLAPGFGRRRAGRGGFGFPMPAMPRQPNAPGQQQNPRRGLNENYGRELMELHTLGVDGGYSQKDVTEVARAFTGWTIEMPRAGGGFRFDPRLHDEGQKVVLGHVIKAGGEHDGEEVLDILARHPATARFIATKLTRHFVSDTPPPALVDRVAARFRETDGDLREVMRTILTSPEFLSPDAYRAKVKTPFEFVVSTIRATGADVHEATPLVRTVQQLGMPLYQCQPPTGYKDTADAWVNTGALVSRLNFALQLAGGRLPGTSLEVSGNPIDTALGGDVSDATRATIQKASLPEQALALTLGSPEFQRR